MLDAPRSCGGISFVSSREYLDCGALFELFLRRSILQYGCSLIVREIQSWGSTEGVVSNKVTVDFRAISLCDLCLSYWRRQVPDVFKSAAVGPSSFYGKKIPAGDDIRCVFGRREQ
jgi:hypothetical protein